MSPYMARKLRGEFHGSPLFQFGVGDNGHTVVAERGERAALQRRLPVVADDYQPGIPALGILLRVIPTEHDVFHGVLVESVRCLAEPGRMVGATLEQEIEAVLVAGYASDPHVRSVEHMHESSFNATSSAK